MIPLTGLRRMIFGFVGGMATTNFYLDAVTTSPYRQTQQHGGKGPKKVLIQTTSLADDMEHWIQRNEVAASLLLGLLVISGSLSSIFGAATAVYFDGPQGAARYRRLWHEYHASLK